MDARSLSALKQFVAFITVVPVLFLVISVFLGESVSNAIGFGRSLFWPFVIISAVIAIFNSLIRSLIRS